MNQTEKNEASFHDTWANESELSEIFVDEAFESLSSPENRQILHWMGDVRGKKILEIGCGLGEASVYFAKKGALVTATDISPAMVEKAKSLASFHGTKVDGVVVSANHLDNIPDSSFDYVFAGNLLHHVDIGNCIKSLKPKLKPGGSAFFWDPIAYNPVINVYRKMATNVRTEDEHPLTVKDMDLIRSQFKSVELRFFWLTSLAIFLWYYLVKGIDPNKERYWKKILKDSKDIARFLRISQKVDNVLFTLIPPLRYFAWNVVIKASNS